MTPTPILGFADPLSSWLHLAAAGLAYVGAWLLYLRGRGNTTRVVALTIFSVSLIFLFSMSGTYHLLERGGVARDILRRLDHAGIWLFIASTFTPIHVILFRQHWRWAVLLFVWLFAMIALVVDVLYIHNIPEGLLLSLFIGLGWTGALTSLLFVKRFRHHSIVLFLIGAVCYSAGAIIDYMNWPVLITGLFGPHEIFHVFVIFGAIAHWCFIYYWSDQPVDTNMVFDVVVQSERKIFARSVEDKFEVIAHSVTDLKQRVKREVDRRCHATIKPRIVLRFLREEHLG